MNHTGIIAEYNPFHNGHKFLMDKVPCFGDKNGGKIIVAMSGSFTQRGEPAVINKFSRAKTALMAGASLVLELPVRYVLSGAEGFARGAVSLLSSAGAGRIAFGAEDDNLDTLEKVAEVLAAEPGAYKKALGEYLSGGESFAKARVNAVSAALNNSIDPAVLKKPNNILALEYLSAIIKYAPHIKAVPIKRAGAEHDAAAPSFAEGLPYASASYLRNLGKSGRVDCAKDFMPRCSFEIFKAERTDIEIDRYSLPLHYILLQENFKPKDLFYENNKESASIWRNISKISKEESLISAITERAASKRHTKARVRREIFRKLLNLPPENRARPDFPAYIRVLGFRREDAFLLSDISKNSALPLITNLKNIEKALGGDNYSAETSMNMLKEDMFAYELSLLGHESAENEYRIPMVMV